MERENPNATPLRGAHRRCDRPSTCGSQTQGPGQSVIESLAEGPLEEKSAFEFPILHTWRAPDFERVRALQSIASDRIEWEDHASGPRG